MSDVVITGTNWTPVEGLTIDSGYHIQMKRKLYGSGWEGLPFLFTTGTTLPEESSASAILTTGEGIAFTKVAGQNVYVKSLYTGNISCHVEELS